LCTGGSLQDRIECAAISGGSGGGRAYPPLQWDHRLRIAVAIAQALKHLHTLTPPMLHRDVKSANVLLDEGGNAKVRTCPRVVCVWLLNSYTAAGFRAAQVADFGTVRIGVVAGDKTHVTTKETAGTKGESNAVTNAQAPASLLTIH
jgi:serine/threonine protein kinase